MPNHAAFDARCHRANAKECSARCDFHLPTIDRQGRSRHQNQADPQRATGMAQFAYQQYGGKTKYKAMQIFVFRTREAATEFNRFQIGNKYNVVADDDYPGLAALWPQCIVLIASFLQISTIEQDYGFF